MTKIIIIFVFLLVATSTWAGEIPDGFELLKSREQIHSTLGFSFVPPAGTNWYEKFEESKITYLKKIESKSLTFYAGVLEGQMRSNLSDDDNLLNFVKSKKDQWGKDGGRYRNTSALFTKKEEIGPFCIGYQLAAEDHKALNLDGEKFLQLSANGIFCLHPLNKMNAVDIYYSARSLPSAETDYLNNEGNNFLSSLKFISK